MAAQYKTVHCKGGCGRTDCVAANASNEWWCSGCVEADIAAAALKNGQFTAWSRFRGGNR